MFVVGGEDKVRSIIPVKIGTSAEKCIGDSDCFFNLSEKIFPFSALTEPNRMNMRRFHKLPFVSRMTEAVMVT